MDKPKISGWEVITNKQGVKMAVVNHSQFIDTLAYLEHIESILADYSVLEWTSSDNPPAHKGEYLVRIEGYSKDIITSKCEYLGSGWWRHPNYGTINEYVTHWAIVPEPKI